MAPAALEGPPPPAALKKSYKPTAQLQVFLTGGRPALSRAAERLLCACGEDVKVVQLASGAVERTLGGDSEAITAVAVSPDGQSAFSSSRSLQTSWWHVASGECKRSWKAHEWPVTAMAADASGGLLATGSSMGEVRVWDVEKAFCTHSFSGHRGVVSCLTFHPDPYRLLLLSAGEDGVIQVWDLVTRSSVARFEKHFSAVADMAFSPSGWTLISAGRDKVVNVWNLREYTHQTTIPVFESLEGVCVVPEDSCLPGALRESVPPVKKTKKSSESLRFLTVGERGVVRVWRSDSGACVYEQKDSDAAAPEGKEGETSTEIGGFTAALLLDPRGTRLMCVTADQRLLIYEGEQGGKESADETKGENGIEEDGAKGEKGESKLKLVRQLIGNMDEVVDLRFVDSEEKRLAVATNSAQVRIFDIATGACAASLKGHTDTVLCLDVNLGRKGRPLLATGAKDNSVRVWDIETGTCLGVATGHTAAVTGVAFSKKTGEFLLSAGSDRTLKFWAMEGVTKGSGPLQLKSKAAAGGHEKAINALAVAPNDGLACTGSQDRTAKLWKLPELALSFTLSGHKRGVWCVEFSPAEQLVLTASGDMTVRVWATADGACLKTLEGHTGSVLRAAFLSKGAQIVSSGADGLVKLWTLRTGECVNTFEHHDDKVWALAVSSTTELLATGGSDSLVTLWTDCTAAEEEEALKQEEEELLQSQALSNALKDGKHAQALKLAFTLNRPGKMLVVLSELLKVENGEEQIRGLLGAMAGEEVRILLTWLRDWNSNAKHCHVAQKVLLNLLSCHSPADLLQVAGIREIAEGLLPYTQRHFSRIDRLLRSTFLLDYTLASMAVLSPVDEGVGAPLLSTNGQVNTEVQRRKKTGKGKGKGEGEENVKRVEDKLQGVMEEEGAMKEGERENEKGPSRGEGEYEEDGMEGSGEKGKVSEGEEVKSKERRKKRNSKIQPENGTEPSVRASAGLSNEEAEGEGEGDGRGGDVLREGEEPVEAVTVSQKKRRKKNGDGSERSEQSGHGLGTFPSPKVKKKAGKRVVNGGHEAHGSDTGGKSKARLKTLKRRTSM